MQVLQALHKEEHHYVSFFSCYLVVPPHKVSAALLLTLFCHVPVCYFSELRAVSRLGVVKMRQNHLLLHKNPPAVLSSCDDPSTMVQWPWHSTADRKVAGLSPNRGSHILIETEMLEGTVYCAMSVHVTEAQVAKICRALHYGISHYRIVVLGRKSQEIY